jgi:hypothetical protein
LKWSDVLDRSSAGSLSSRLQTGQRQRYLPFAINDLRTLIMVAIFSPFSFLYRTVTFSPAAGVPLVFVCAFTTNVSRSVLPFSTEETTSSELDEETMVPDIFEDSVALPAGFEPAARTEPAIINPRTKAIKSVFLFISLLLVTLG